MLFQNRNRRSYIERFIVIFLAALFTVYLVSCSQEQKGPPKPRARPTVSAETIQTVKSKLDIHNVIAVIETDKGAIEVEFFADVAPKTVENFLKNARLEYYNHATFHRVEPGKLIQTGSRFPIEDTIAIEASDHKPVRGILAMAKEEGSGGSGCHPVLHLPRHTYLRQRLHPIWAGHEGVGCDRQHRGRRPDHDHQGS